MSNTHVQRIQTMELQTNRQTSMSELWGYQQAIIALSSPPGDPFHLPVGLGVLFQPPRPYLSHVLDVSMPSPISFPLVDWAFWLDIRPGSSLPVWWSPENCQNLMVPPSLPTLLVDRGWYPSSQGITCHVSHLATLIAQLPSPHSLRTHTINLKQILLCQCCHWHLCLPPSNELRTLTMQHSPYSSSSHPP